MKSEKEDVLERFLEHVRENDPIFRTEDGAKVLSRLHGHAEYFRQKYLHVHVLDEDETGERTLMGLED